MIQVSWLLSDHNAFFKYYYFDWGGQLCRSDTFFLKSRSDIYLYYDLLHVQILNYYGQFFLENQMVKKKS